MGRPATGSRGIRAAGVLLLVPFSLAPALASETGSVCVHDYSAGVSCTGEDVRIAAIQPVQILEDCPSGQVGTAEAVFDILVAAGSLNGYDIGIFLALGGGSAVSGGSCFHDYLEPPLEPNPSYGDSNLNGVSDIRGGPWWNAEPFDFQDECGDIQGNTEAIKISITLRIACVDADLDGTVDLSACASWSSGTSSSCGNLRDAYPPTGMRCGCGLVETGVPMAAVGTPSGRVAGLTLETTDSGDLLLAWSPSCSASDTDYAVYEGMLGSFSSHHSVVCSTAGMTSATIEPAAGDSYYLVVPRNAEREGSYGQNGAGAERPPAAEACAPQLVQDPCL